mmetsp:Transcript_26163/g.57102  ORF Transcript_26163/g.57102 Transcript_26163/m.57102 type:complete len:250 (+) Transcript_26163:643-1392(+)
MIFLIKTSCRLSNFSAKRAPTWTCSPFKWKFCTPSTCFAINDARDKINTSSIFHSPNAESAVASSRNVGMPVCLLNFGSCKIRERLKHASYFIRASRNASKYTGQGFNTEPGPCSPRSLYHIPLSEINHNDSSPYVRSIHHSLQTTPSNRPERFKELNCFRFQYNGTSPPPKTYGSTTVPYINNLPPPSKYSQLTGHPSSSTNKKLSNNLISIPSPSFQLNPRPTPSSPMPSTPSLSNSNTSRPHRARS